MIRMLGVISGAAIAIVLLTWFVGVPQFTTERPAADLPAQVVDLVEATAPPESPPEPAVMNPTADAPALAASEPVDEPLAAAVVNNVLPAAAQPELQWFAFWSPFRSKIAAEGFVSQLQRVTGLDYRVVRVKPGVYEVAFAYSQNDEIDLNLSTISAATGLDLPGDR